MSWEIKEECGTCKYFNMNTSMCQKNPPQAFHIADGKFLTMWAKVMPDFWCGSWKEKEKKHE